MSQNKKLNSTNLIIIFSVICILVALGLIINSIVSKTDDVNPASSSSSISAPIPSSSSESSSSSSSSQSVSDPASPTNRPIPVVLPGTAN